MTEQPNTEMNPTGQAAPEGLISDQFQTDEVSATRGREQGLGVGERELNAQRDPGVEMAADEDEELDETDEADDDQDDVTALDGDPAVQGDDEEEEDGAGV